MRSHSGFVTEVTRDSITIQYLEDDPKRFEVSDVLASGGYVRKNNTPGDMYRLTDVRVGDKVNISYSRIGGVDICTHICILRRPGGRVPQSPGDPDHATNKIHDRMNAYQDAEERGIPIPPKYDSSPEARHKSNALAGLIGGHFQVYPPLMLPIVPLRKTPR